MNEKLQQEDINQLFQGILTLKSVEECYRFFEDICTIHELQSMAQRLDVAKLLRDKVTYQEICEKTGASTATISRVGRALNYGADGYKIVLDRIEKEKENGPNQ